MQTEELAISAGKRLGGRPGQPHLESRLGSGLWGDSILEPISGTDL